MRGRPTDMCLSQVSAAFLYVHRQHLLLADYDYENASSVFPQAPHSSVLPHVYTLLRLFFLLLPMHHFTVFDMFFLLEFFFPSAS